MGSHSPPCSTVEWSIAFLQVSFLISQVILQSPVFLIPINFVAVTAQWVPLTPSFQIQPIWLNFNLLLRCASIPLCLLYEVKNALADEIFFSLCSHIPLGTGWFAAIPVLSSLSKCCYLLHPFPHKKHLSHLSAHAELELQCAHMLQP